MLFVGDVHGKHTEFEQIVREHTAEHDIVQLGDLGFSRSWDALNDFDLDNGLGVIPGNHEDYDAASESSYNLGDYGTAFHLGQRFWFCRGGASIDRNIREARYLAGNPKTFWHEEELDFTEMNEALHNYRIAKPDIVATHAAPVECIKHILGEPHKNDPPRKFGFPIDWYENTSRMLQRALDYHRPKLWIFGHYHKSADYVQGGTRFICLEELETFTLNEGDI